MNCLSMLCIWFTKNVFAFLDYQGELQRKQVHEVYINIMVARCKSKEIYFWLIDFVFAYTSLC